MGLGSPPPTRGSTAVIVDDVVAVAVSPAHAGIDRSSTGGSRPRPGLPRPRGDRPSSPMALALSMQSPPPTRGSTQPAHVARRGAAVSPAHAGIDRQGRPPSRRSRRLPRPRGDRPRRAPPAAGLPRSPPPTRGSTPSLFTVQGTGSVSPAHAGIDLSKADWDRVPRGLPRPRGDRPSRSCPRVRHPASPPPTRGSTQSGQHGGRIRIVSPAHAGIDPARAVRLRLADGLPRPRGDRPLAVWVATANNLSPPPTRGSTAPLAAPRGGHLVSPAHAGIDRFRAYPSGAPPGLPRPRGDRPLPPDPSHPTSASPPPTRGSTAP